MNRASVFVHRRCYLRKQISVWLLLYSAAGLLPVYGRLWSSSRHRERDYLDLSNVEDIVKDLAEACKEPRDSLVPRLYR